MRLIGDDAEAGFDLPEAENGPIQMEHLIAQDHSLQIFLQRGGMNPIGAIVSRLHDVSKGRRPSGLDPSL